MHTSSYFSVLNCLLFAIFFCVSNLSMAKVTAQDQIFLCPSYAEPFATIKQNKDSAPLKRKFTKGTLMDTGTISGNFFSTNEGVLELGKAEIEISNSGPFIVCTYDSATKKGVYEVVIRPQRVNRCRFLNVLNRGKSSCKGEREKCVAVCEKAAPTIATRKRGYSLPVTFDDYASLEYSSL